jgi:hypothetical protein
MFRRPRRGEFRPSSSDDRRAGHSRPCLAIRLCGSDFAILRGDSGLALTLAEFQSISFRLNAPFAMISPE